MPTAARPSLLERLQQQVAKLEREKDFLGQVDRTMRLRLAQAVEEADRLKKQATTQGEMLIDLRRQLDARAADLAVVRAELEAEKAARPAPPPSKKEAPAPVERPLVNLEVD